jgi:hypothetical protein
VLGPHEGLELFGTGVDRIGVLSRLGDKFGPWNRSASPVTMIATIP